MDVVVVLKFCKGEKVVPTILSLINKKAEKMFLVNSFCLSVSLRVVCSSGSQLDSEKSVEFIHEFHYKLGDSVQYHLLGQSMVFPDVSEVKLCSSSS